MVVAILAAITGISCGLGLFATFRVNHEPLARLAEGSPPLQLALNNRALGSEAGAPLEAGLPGKDAKSHAKSRAGTIWSRFGARRRFQRSKGRRAEPEQDGEPCGPRRAIQYGAGSRRAWTAGGSGIGSATGRCRGDRASNRANGDYQCRSAGSAAGREAEKSGREQGGKAGSQNNALGASAARRQDGSRSPNGS